MLVGIQEERVLGLLTDWPLINSGRREIRSQLDHSPVQVSPFPTNTGLTTDGKGIPFQHLYFAFQSGWIMSSVPSFLKSKWFWAFTIPTTTVATYVAYDRRAERHEFENFMNKASKFGDIPVGEKLKVYGVVTFADDRASLRDILSKWRKYVAPLLTKAGIDYRLYTFTFKELAKELNNLGIILTASAAEDSSSESPIGEEEKRMIIESWRNHSIGNENMLSKLWERRNNNLMAAADLVSLDALTFSVLGKNQARVIQCDTPRDLSWPMRIYNVHLASCVWL